MTVRTPGWSRASRCESGDPGLAEAGELVQQQVAADPGVGDGQRAVVGDEPFGQGVGVPGIAADGGVVAVGDGVPERHDRLGAAGGNVYPGQVVVRVAGSAVEGCGSAVAYMVTGCLVGGGQAVVVEGRRTGSAGEEERDGQWLQRRDVQAGGVRGGDLPGGDGDGAAAAEGQGTHRARLGCRAASGLGDGRCCDAQRLGPVQIGQADPYPAAPAADPHLLTDGLVREPLRGPVRPYGLAIGDGLLHC